MKENLKSIPLCSLRLPGIHSQHRHKRQPLHVCVCVCEGGGGVGGGCGLNISNTNFTEPLYDYNCSYGFSNSQLGQLKLNLLSQLQNQKGEPNPCGS